jgi:uncharacterized protein YbgA (DUF1722 family)
MRVWDVHPGYLFRSSLLGQHAEIHALLSVVINCKKGYGAHPETLRWKGRLDKLKLRHELTVKEMKLRGYSHASPFIADLDCNSGAEGLDYVDHPAGQFEILRQKYLKGTAGRIPLPLRRSDFWAHHKYSVMARSYQYYKEIQAFLNLKKDLPISEDLDLIERVQEILEKPVQEKALANVVHHLWGYFKKEASPHEREKYLNWPQGQLYALLDCFYCMAQKYDKKYLLQSTVFADLINEV